MADDTGGAPTPQAVRTQAERVLASDRFGRSARSSALLRYVVDETLAGRGDRISATTIAQDVLGKGADFDSGSDPLVRVQMGRMRALLASWYDDHPGEASVCIRVPKGTYQPVFEPMGPDAAGAGAAAAGTAGQDTARAGAAGTGTARIGTAANDSPALAAPMADGAGRQREAVDPQRSPPPPGFRFRPGHAVAAGLVALIAGVGWLASGLGDAPRTTSYPVLVVRPFENLTGEAANEALSRGLQRQLASDLQRFRTVRVALAATGGDGPAVPRHGSQRAGRRMAKREAAPAADYALSGTILSADDELDFTVDLTDLNTGTLIDRRRLRGEAGGDYYDVLADLSRTATGRLVGGGGALERAAHPDLADGLAMPAVNSMAAFRCLVIFDEFTRGKTPERARAAHDCLTEQVAAKPGDSTLLAALAWTRGLVAPEAGQVEAGPWAAGYTIKGALALAERAVAAGPGDDLAHEHLALLQWRSGQRDEAVRSLRRALALNPGNPNLAADLALYLGFLGRWDEALRLSDLAYERSGDPPGWYALPRFYRALLEADGNEAVRLAGIVSPGDPFGPVYELAAAVTAEDEAAVAALRGEVAELAARQDGDPLRAARPWIRSEPVLGVLEDRLATAGIEVVGA